MYNKFDYKHSKGIKVNPSYCMYSICNSGQNLDLICICIEGPEQIWIIMFGCAQLDIWQTNNKDIFNVRIRPTQPFLK